jgi:nicotinamide-nucleotide adenylyltransferase
MVKLILEEYNGVTFGIGSSQYEDTPENPFSFEERARMIASTMEREGFENYKILAIEDLHDDERWVNLIMELVPDLRVVYSNDSLTVRLLREEGLDVRVMPLAERDRLSGTEVRRRILENGEWEELVPGPVRSILMEISGYDRIGRSRGASDTDED